MRSIGHHWLPLSRSREFLFAVILAAVTILAYHPVWNGGFLWDDDDYITTNELLTAPDALRRIWFSFDSPSQYFPLTYTTFRLEHALWGLNPTGYHMVNILLHVTNALLLWRLLAHLRIPGGWLAAAIFALHPVQVESVAWITERKNVLMGFFFLLALLAWVQFIDDRTKRPWRSYWLALLFYVLALFSKATACTLPAALFLTLWLQKKPITKARLLQIVPFIVLGAGMGLLTMWWERYHQGTHGAHFALGPIERVLIAGHAIWFYLGKLFWPSNLTFIYPKWAIAPTNPFNYIWLLALGGLAILIYLARRYVGRSAEVAALFFVATLAPVLGFIMLYTFRYTFVADHYQYLASIGPIALVSAGAASLARALKKKGSWIVILATCGVGLLSVATWRQSRMYGDIEALWRTTLARNPSCWMAHNNLGLVLFQKGHMDEAIAHYGATLNLEPDFWDAEYNLGSALLSKGEVDDAIVHCARAVALEPNDPDAQTALANALAEKGQIDDAISHYERALALRPGYFFAHHGLGHAFLLKNEIDAAIFHCRAAVSLQPENADAQTNLAIALDEKGETAEAITHYEKALEISPESVAAANNLAWILATSSDAAVRNGIRSLELARKANELSGGANPAVLHTLAAAYAAAGQFDEAIANARRASRQAAMEGNHALAAELEREIVAYQAGSACGTNRK